MCPLGSHRHPGKLERPYAPGELLVEPRRSWVVAQTRSSALQRGPRVAEPTSKVRVGRVWRFPYGTSTKMALGYPDRAASGLFGWSDMDDARHTKQIVVSQLCLFLRPTGHLHPGTGLAL